MGFALQQTRFNMQQNVIYPTMKKGFTIKHVTIKPKNKIQK